MSEFAIKSVMDQLLIALENVRFFIKYLYFDDGLHIYTTTKASIRVAYKVREFPNPISLDDCAVSKLMRCPASLKQDICRLHQKHACNRRNQGEIQVVFHSSQHL